MLKEKLNDCETIVAEAKISKASILLDWLSIPSVLLIIFLSVCLPVLLDIYSSVHKLETIAKVLGVEEVKFFDLVANMGIAFRLPKFLIVFMDVMLGLLVISWFVWACVKTKWHFGYELIATDSRLLLWAKGQFLESKWLDVKNVFIGQSLWGRIFNYGTVTVHCKNGALTVKNITNPLQYQKEFYNRNSGEFV